MVSVRDVVGSVVSRAFGIVWGWRPNFDDVGVTWHG